MDGLIRYPYHVAFDRMRLLLLVRPVCVDLNICHSVQPVDLTLDRQF